MRTRTGARLRVVLLTAMLAPCASATDAAPVTWDISVFNLTGVLSGNTYSGTVTVDDMYLLPGAQVLTPSNSDLSIVFDFVDDDGVTPRRFTEADDIDYPAFPSFSLLNGVPVPHPTMPPAPPKGPLSFVYFDDDFNELWEFGSFTYYFDGGGTGESTFTRTDAAPVPEPTTLVLVGIGLGAQAHRRRKNRDRFIAWFLLHDRHTLDTGTSPRYACRLRLEGGAGGTNRAGARALFCCSRDCDDRRGRSRH